MKNKDLKKGQIVLYKSSKNEVQLDVRLEGETIWLDAKQMASLFGTQRPAIVKHVNNIYKTSELSKNLTCSILEQVAADGKKRKINFYNLDMIISVGYRVNSRKATQFRVWATKILRTHLIKGYTINQKRLLAAQYNFRELQEAVSLLQEQSRKDLLQDQAAEILYLLASYSKTLSLLSQYDKEKFKETKGKKTKFVLEYSECVGIVSHLKKELIIKKEASSLFGQSRGGSFEGIIKGLYQTFDKKELYPTIEDKASHLLYLIIKDHPFIDGNKRTAAFLFVYFLDKSNYLFKSSGERKINDNALTALALLVAESDPKDKEIMIKITKSLIAG